jgi:putative transposase
LLALAAERHRFGGFRRLSYLLAREGTRPNHKKLLRIYREEGLQVRRRGGRKRAVGTRGRKKLLDGLNQRWPLDFARQTAHGCQRPRHRTDLVGNPSLVAGATCRVTLHRAGQADAERFVESLNCPLRDECLNETLFTSLSHAQFVRASWRCD